MKGMVWGSTYYIASKKLDKIIKDYKTYGIKPLRIVKSKNNHWAKFENGDIWQACATRESACGIRANIAYIDHMISPIFIDEVIKPCLTAFPFQAFHYYWPEEDNFDDKNFI